MSKQELFIGSRKIRAVLDDPKDKDGVIVTFKDGSQSVLKRKLYNLIIKTEKGNGDTIHEVANAYIGIKFLKELAEYDYELCNIQAVCVSMGGLATNLSEQKIGEKFGVVSSDRIKLSDIL